jgi:hypothetical protein
LIVLCVCTTALALDSKSAVCTGISADRRSVIPGESVQLEANATHPSGKPLTYKWTTTGGRLKGEGTKVTFLSGGLAPGKYTVKCEVSDGYNPSIDCTVDITVVESSPPN